mmetsp:Transcript_774/g.1504  ORF Transcript_774/g.1504 Transcript_774/m.1504 type:complete len:85 (+) Transcript_774:320-574(+)
MPSLSWRSSFNECTEASISTSQETVLPVRVFTKISILFYRLIKPHHLGTPVTPELSLLSFGKQVRGTTSKCILSWEGGSRLIKG